MGVTRRVLSLLVLGASLTGCGATEGTGAATTDINPPVSITKNTTENGSSTTSTSTSTTLQSSESDPIDVGPLSPRGGHSVVWTGAEMIVWGGEADETGTTVYSDGAGYDPEEDAWRPLAPSPLSGRRYHVAVWTGEEMLIFGGVNERDGAAYRPDTDSWEPLAASPVPLGPSAGAPIEGVTGWVWTGTEMIVWHVPTDLVASYNPDTDQWRELPATGLGADNGVLRWSREAVYAFGATIETYPEGNELLVARLGDGRWESLASTEFSTETNINAAIPKLTAWAGDRFVAWSNSGQEGKTLAFQPVGGAWTEIAKVPVPSCEGQGEPSRRTDR